MCKPLFHVLDGIVVVWFLGKCFKDMARNSFRKRVGGHNGFANRFFNGSVMGSKSRGIVFDYVLSKSVASKYNCLLGSCGRFNCRATISFADMFPEEGLGLGTIGFGWWFSRTISEMVVLEVQLLRSMCIDQTYFLEVGLGCWLAMF